MTDKIMVVSGDPWWYSICKEETTQNEKDRRFAKAMRWPLDEKGYITVPERYAKEYNSYRDFMGTEDKDEARALEIQYWGFISRTPLKRVNLLQETLDCLRENGKTPEEVLWVGDWKESYSWDDFIKAADFTYLPRAWRVDSNDLDPRQTPSLLRAGLKIVGKDWWLERADCWDRSERWEFYTLPTRPKCGDKTLVLLEDWKKD